MINADYDPTFHDEAADIGRLNIMLDELTERRFASAAVFAGTIRQALELFSITLPLLPIEGTNPPSTDAEDSQVPDDGEYVFQIGDEAGDTDNDVYLYIVCDKDEDGFYTGYAQVVNGDDLADMTDDDMLDREFPELVGDADGETPYIQQVRFQGYDKD
jgi:hypothetical protein